jgi:hypothetical protein
LAFGVLSGLTAGIWMHSYWHSDFVNFQSRPPHDARVFTSVEACARSGQLQIIFEREVWDSTIPDGAFNPSEWQFGTNGAKTLDSLAGFQDPPGPTWAIGHVVNRWQGQSNFFSAGGISSQTRCDVFYAPLGLLSALLAVTPTAWVICRIRMKKWVLKGLCPKCGYDLRASVTRCPECGTAISRGPDAA